MHCRMVPSVWRCVTENTSVIWCFIEHDIKPTGTVLQLRTTQRFSSWHPGTNNFINLILWEPAKINLALFFFHIACQWPKISEYIYSTCCDGYGIIKYLGILLLYKCFIKYNVLFVNVLQPASHQWSHRGPISLPKAIDILLDHGVGRG